MSVIVNSDYQVVALDNSEYYCHYSRFMCAIISRENCQMIMLTFDLSLLFSLQMLVISAVTSINQASQKLLLWLTFCHFYLSMDIVVITTSVNVTALLR